MPFKPEVVSLSAQGAASLQHDHSDKDAWSRGSSRAEVPGDAKHHVTATPKEIYDFCKVRDYPAGTTPNGVFFLLEDGASQKILACSANIAQLFGTTPSEALGQRFSTLFGDSNKIDAALSSENFLAANPITLSTNKGSREGELAPVVNVILQRSPNGITADVEELDPCEDFLAVNDAVRAAVGMLDTCSSPQELCQQIVWDSFNILGCDRVLMLHSHEDGTSEVNAERRSKRINNSFLGQSWPATDLDPTTRLRAIQRSYCRYIVDASADNVELVTLGDRITASEVCLKDSTLLPAQGCLRQQMGAWGSKAMTSWSIVSQGRMWGLLCAHHASAKAYSFQTRIAMDLLVAGFNLRLSKLLDAACLAQQESMFKLTSLLVHRAREQAAEAQVKAFFDGAASVASAVEGCKAAALLHGGAWTTFGDAPAPELLAKLAEACQAKFPAATEPQGLRQVVSVVPEWAPAQAKTAGALYAPLPGLEGSCLLLFRPELSTPTVWAGDPSVPATKDRQSGIVYPRSLYNDVAVKNTGRSAAWVQADVEAAQGVARVLAAALQGTLATETPLLSVLFPAFAVDGAGVVTQWNDAAAATTGVAAAAAVGKTAASLLLPRSEASMQGMLVQAVQGVQSGGGELSVASPSSSAPELQGHLAVRAVPFTGGAGVFILGLDRRLTFSAEAKYKKLSTQLSNIDRSGASLRPNNMVINVQATEDNFEYFPDKDDSAEALVYEDRAGKVYLMVNRKDGALYEVRKINMKKAGKGGTSAVEVKRELVPLLRLAHPGVVRCRACFPSSEGKNLHIVSDFEGDKLASLIAAAPSGLPEAQCAWMAKQLLQTLADLHARGIQHSNLSTMTVVMMHDGTIKVGDIGIKALLRADAVGEKEDVFAAGKVLMAALGDRGKTSGLANKLAPLLAADPAARPTAADAVALFGHPTQGL